MDIRGSSEQNSSKKPSTIHTWSKFEEDSLFRVLKDVVVKCGNRCDNETLKSGTLKEIEKAMNNLIPNSGLRTTPHIENKIRMLKKQYGIVYDVLNKNGFAWNDVKCVEVDSKEAWLNYVQMLKDGETNRFLYLRD
ncbi:Myb/SANT-like domain containing protein [Parasponia andersonii]|uniref:Myb/SANT-like domain containing protein n=1 Tax=Parasponia andersonii TaxID=3476 RepID=A0A2P5B6B1_PARAD|nr:Myb/SANT-like domain containing protein [Parasponia andersonii]